MAHAALRAVLGATGALDILCAIALVCCGATPRALQLGALHRATLAREGERGRGPLLRALGGWVLANGLVRLAAAARGGEGLLLAAGLTYWAEMLTVAVGVAAGDYLPWRGACAVALCGALARGGLACGV